MGYSRGLVCNVDHLNLVRYITCLVEMTKFEGTRHGKLIANQMLDVTIRVKDVRPFAVKQMVCIPPLGIFHCICMYFIYLFCILYLLYLCVFYIFNIFRCISYI